MWARRALVGLGIVAAAGAAAVWWGERRWRLESAALVDQLVARQARPGLAYSEAELVGLPAPVARYFRRVLRPGQPMVTRAHITWTGEFNMGRPGQDNWRPFAAEQEFVPGAPGFVWNARIAMMPAVSALVRDGFVDGRGSMKASALGLVPIVDAGGTPTLAAGALQRYLGEAQWLPTALLPSQGVSWRTVDDSRAVATIRGGSTTVSLEFRFGPDGLVASVFTPERFYDDGRNPPVPRPWQARNLRYEERSGVTIPTEAVVEWLLPEGTFAYWRGSPTAVRYE